MRITFICIILSTFLFNSCTEPAQESVDLEKDLTADSVVADEGKLVVDGPFMDNGEFDGNICV